MTFKFISKLSLLLLIGIVTFSSCTKEDSVTVVETEEEITPEDTGIFFKMTINGNAIETDAVASYCQNDSLEFIMVSNKVGNLQFPLPFDFEEGDFTFFTSISEYEEYNLSYGGITLGEEVTGFEGLYATYSDAVITITSNDGEVVVGNSEGTLIGINEEGTIDFEYPYSIDFVAEIVEESTYCEQ